MMKSGWDTLRTAQPDLDFIVESLIKFESLDPRYSDRCVFEGVYFIHPKKIVAQLEKKIADLAGKPEELGYHIMPIVLDSLLGTNIPLVDIFKLNDQWLG